MPQHTGEQGSIGSIGGYELVDRLGSGGMGVVYLARSVSGRQVAVKVVHAQYALDEEFRARFRQEVAAARRVSGAFTAPVVDADPDAELPWMATLYVPGRTLSEMVDREGPLGGRELRALALGLVEALKDIHQAGVVHRDLKPSNVLMAGDGPRVIDFGISRAADSQALTVTGRLIGTPPFMSPEQFASPRDVTAASDVFSLGSLLAFAATGNGPFDGGSPYVTGYQVMNEPPSLDGVPQPLRGIVERCLDKDPAVRPELAELHWLFRELPETSTAPSASGPPTVPEGRRAARKTEGATSTGSGRRGRRVRLLVAAGVALAVAVSASVYLVTRPRTTEDTSAGGTSASGSAAAAPAFPAGWRPWQTSLVRAVKSDSVIVDVDGLDSGCVPGGSSVYCAGTGFTVARVDAASGRVLWRFGSNPQSTRRPLGVENGIVYTTDEPDADEVGAALRLLAIDADTGERLWTRPVDAGRPAALFDGGGILVMPEGGKEFVAVNARTGEDMWRTPAKSSAGTDCTVVVMGRAPYGMCSDEDGPADGPMGFLRLDPADGTPRELKAPPRGAAPLGAVGGQPLFALPRQVDWQSSDGRDEAYEALQKVNPTTGAAVRIPLAGTPRGTATVIDGVVYFVRPDGTVTANRATDGTRLWQRETQVENLSAPVLSKKYNTLYFANRYGRLLALDRTTGTEQWTTDKLKDPGSSAEQTIPSLLLTKDAIVAVAGNKAFSTSPDRAP
ncbi:protein kinase domain-containing protein [Streptomyces liliifuscus]|uniref:PQQ-binding-like beta-propeller repeat protein n=1 Tax=Streptomyces liliifuscus TaxID=2797636 RepID=A0A7T7KWU8_9ACTN|nr:serine/threonine-protein kinase [Streptomyces liliifuscus]QQM41567.1 PQQ-binding-like beta-propeller repeat protein [Streptomyces liliifuscus]